MIVLPAAYFPPVSYFSLLKRGDIFLEAFENYQKQSWRNRCRILTANGPEDLVVPVVHTDGSFRHPIAEIPVDYSKGWLQRHKRAIDSAYMSSPFFEYYRDNLYKVLDTKPDTLWKLDLSLTEFFVRALSLRMPSMTEQYTGISVDIHPKRPDMNYVERPYFQVFANKFGFVPNLSVMDLLFNEGPGAAEYL